MIKIIIVLCFCVARLYHGWLVDPQNEELFSVIGDVFYNKCVEMALEDRADGSHLMIQEFLQSTSNQLTYHGLFELTSQLNEQQVTVLFRNNHFSTITKHQGQTSSAHILFLSVIKRVNDFIASISTSNPDNLILNFHRTIVLSLIDFLLQNFFSLSKP